MRLGSRRFDGPVVVYVDSFNETEVDDFSWNDLTSYDSFDVDFYRGHIADSSGGSDERCYCADDVIDKRSVTVSRCRDDRVFVFDLFDAGFCRCHLGDYGWELCRIAGGFHDDYGADNAADYIENDVNAMKVRRRRIYVDEDIGASVVRGFRGVHGGRGVHGLYGPDEDGSGGIDLIGEVCDAFAGFSIMILIDWMLSTMIITVRCF